jgi:hypothetical protein
MEPREINYYGRRGKKQKKVQTHFKSVQNNFVLAAFYKPVPESVMRK